MQHAIEVLNRRFLSMAPFNSRWILINTGMSRYGLTDSNWCVIEPLLPNKPRGVLRIYDRQVLNGIF